MLDLRRPSRDIHPEEVAKERLRQLGYRVEFLEVFGDSRLE